MNDGSSSFHGMQISDTNDDDIDKNNSIKVVVEQGYSRTIELFDKDGKLLEEDQTKLGKMVSSMKNEIVQKEDYI